jgi:hypothetical protein
MLFNQYHHVVAFLQPISLEVQVEVNKVIRVECFQWRLCKRSSGLSQTNGQPCGLNSQRVREDSRSARSELLRSVM